jgi:hypothetical protein
VVTGRKRAPADDPFDTQSLREHALAAWAASPARFRADANAEEDAAGAGYRDRLVVEVLQNAADSTVGVGGKGGTGSTDSKRTRMLFRLRGGVLEIANTGGPLTPRGVESLAMLRASAKRGRTSVGHFGVGFTAVLAVSDQPAIVSRATGGVQFSRTRTLDEIAAIDGLHDELSRRQGAVPVLRLPWPLTDGYLPPEGYDTSVRLPLRDETQALRLLQEIDPSLLLVLPRVEEVIVEIGEHRRVLRCDWSHDNATIIEDTPDAGHRVHSEWAGVVRRGSVPAEVLLDRPVEERARSGYEIRAFAPLGAWPADVARVVRAPQPTDEPLGLPLVLAAPFPLEAMRRHVVPGPLMDLLLDEAASATAVLVERLTGRDLPLVALDLVPVGLPAGPIDGLLRDALARRLPETRMLPGRRRGRDCAVLDIGSVDDDAYEVLGDVVGGLLPASYAAPSRAAALSALGVRRLSPADVVELVAAGRHPPAWWARVYSALGLVPDRDALGGLPVPLADGRQVTGARGVLLPDPDLDVGALGALPLRIADPAACAGSARDVLLSLGAIEAGPRALLSDPAIDAALEEEDPGLAEPILALAAAAHLRPGEMPGLARLLLPDATSPTGRELAPAGELVLPGAPLDRLLAADAPFGRLAASLADRWPADVLEAVGVLRSFAVLEAQDVLLDPDEPVLLDLDASDVWLRDNAAEGVDSTAVDEFVAIRDLEWIDPARWPEAFEELSQGAMREAVLRSPYTRWWLRSFARLPSAAGDDRLLPELRLPDGDPDLAGCYVDLDTERVRADRDVLSAAGVVDGMPSRRDDQEDLLDRIGAPTRDLPWAQARRLYLRLAGAELEPPASVRSVDGVVDADAAVVVDAPDLLDLLGQRGRLPVPYGDAVAIARLLDLPLASEIAEFQVLSTPVQPNEALRARLAVALGTVTDSALQAMCLHNPLIVRDADGRPTAVQWRVRRADPPMIDLDVEAGPEAQARALAWAADRWGDRGRLEAVLTDPSRAERLSLEADLDGGTSA